MIKHNQIIANKGKFEGATTSFQEDILTMVSKYATYTKNRNTKRTRFKSESEDNNKNSQLKNGNEELPPFIKHTVNIKDGVKTRYKVGDEKQWNGKTFYYCDCPKHKNSYRWHIHKTQLFQTRNKFLREKQTDNKNNKTAETSLVNGEDQDNANEHLRTPKKPSQMLPPKRTNIILAT